MYKQSAIAWTIAVLLFTTSNAASIADVGSPSGVLELTGDQYSEFLGGRIDPLVAVPTDGNAYSGLQCDVGRIPLQPSCSTLYQAYLKKYVPGIQNLANRNCKVYIVIWCCPYGGCYVFTVRPLIKCGWQDPIYIPKIPVWEWPQFEAGITGK